MSIARCHVRNPGVEVAYRYPPKPHGLRWEAKRHTALDGTGGIGSTGPLAPEGSKAVSPLRSATAVQSPMDCGGK